MNKTKNIILFGLCMMLVMAGINTIKAEKDLSIYDVNGDCIIDEQDVALVDAAFGMTGDPGWIPEDVNRDGKVDITDVSGVVTYHGTKLPCYSEPDEETPEEPEQEETPEEPEQEETPEAPDEENEDAKKVKRNRPTKNNNGNGNNEDGVDVSNPGIGNGGPNGEEDDSGQVDDETKEEINESRNENKATGLKKIRIAVFELFKERMSPRLREMFENLLERLYQYRTELNG